MERYITLLIEDLRLAETRERPIRPDYSSLYPNHPANNPAYEGELEYLIEWEFSPEISMCDLFGINAEVFPSASRLDEAQLNRLITAILNLWYAYHINYAHPDPCDSVTLYNNLVELWHTRPVQYVSEGMITIEACDYNIHTCVWGEYCSCLQYQQSRN